MNGSHSPQLSVGQLATLACLWEVLAPKVGNVHRGADFEDLRFDHFLTSAVVIAPAMERAGRGEPLGEVVLEAIRATRQAVGTNTNLGTVLLLAPLAKVPAGEDLAAGIVRVLQSLTPEDACDVYEAIRLAQPGGLGTVEQHDVAAEPPADLLAAMRLAAGRDRVACQYAENFVDLWDCVVPWLEEGLAQGWPLPDVIVHTQLRLLARYPDSLIARKCGMETAQDISARAGVVLEMGWPGEGIYQESLADFDFWLRCDGHRRNPGTTADLIAAGLFAALREGRIPVGLPPFSTSPALPLPAPWNATTSA